ncbi:MAG: restriction endonuclease subunit R [Candidatus Methanomethyliales bacterium]|nr:restriction endonuclease subunit R [Candidatus Methanomethylicales archaeon]
MNNKLFDVIKQLKSNEQLNGYDEAKIKQTVVLRILDILGWDHYNPDEVVPEYSVRGKRVDYALKIGNENKVFIEVKKPNELLEDHQEQLLEYAFAEGVGLALLTNGIDWWFYLPLTEGSWEQRRFYSINLRDQEVEEIVSKFVDLLSKEKIQSGEAINNAKKILESKNRDKKIKEAIPQAWQRLITEVDEELVELLSKKVENICGFRPGIDLIENFLKSLPQISLGPKLPKEPKPGATSPPSASYSYLKIRGFDLRGRHFKVDSWREMLLKLSEIMAYEHSKDFEKVLTLKGKKRPYFSRNKNELRAPKKVGNSEIYLEVNLSADSTVKIAKQVVTLFGYKEDDLKFEYGE